MALTKVTGQVINDTTGLVVGVTTVGGGISATDGFFSGIVTFSNDVSIAGTLTYEDVTNIDAVGLITARNGVVVGSGITLSKDGDGFFTGVVTATSYAGDGSGLTGIAATDNVRTGILDVAGVGTFRNDVNIADKIIHLGDTNTTIRFPSADTITAETGGSERARIDSNGKILAGATSSRTVAGGDAKLQVEATSSEGVSITRTSADGGAVYLSLGKTRNGSACQAGDTIGSISWNPDDGTDLNHAASEIQTVVASGIGGDDVPGDLVFKTNGGATTTTERLRITSNGTLYPIGNGQSFNSATLPNGHNVQINTTSSSHGFSVTRYSGSYAGYALNIGRSKSDTIGTNSLVSNGDDLGHITWYGADGSDFNQAAAITAQVDGTPSDGADMPGRLIFKTSTEGSGTPTEKVRITKSGDFLVGRTNTITIASDPSNACFEQLTDNGMPLTLHCDQSNQRGFGIYYTSGKNASDFIRCQIASSPKFLVTGSGNTQNANNSYGSISDVSLKENIVDANSQWDDIKNIRVRNYNFKESTGQPTHTQIGVVAQELETVSPKLVETSDKDGMKNVQYSVLYMKSVKALQEAMARIETLEAKVAALEGS